MLSPTHSTAVSLPHPQRGAASPMARVRLATCAGTARHWRELGALLARARLITDTAYFVIKSAPKWPNSSTFLFIFLFVCVFSRFFFYYSFLSLLGGCGGAFFFVFFHFSFSSRFFLLCKVIVIQSQLFVQIGIVF